MKIFFHNRHQRIFKNGKESTGMKWNNVRSEKFFLFIQDSTAVRVSHQIYLQSGMKQKKGSYTELLEETTGLLFWLYRILFYLLKTFLADLSLEVKSIQQRT